MVLFWGDCKHLIMVHVLLHVKGLCGGFLSQATLKHVMHSQVNLVYK